MSDRPAVSCVVPTFEAVALVKSCVGSILTQRGVDLELVVTDDSTTSVVRDCVAAMPDARLRFIDGARTGNPVDNWNRGLDRARAEIRLLVHQDEWLADEHYLRDMVQAFANREVAAVIGRTRVSGGARLSRHNRAARVGRQLPNAPWFLPMINWIGPTAAFAFRGPHRFDRALVQLADVEFYTRVLRAGRYAVLPGVRVGSRGYHADQITAAIDAPALALAELAALAARQSPVFDPFATALAKLATRARQWTR